MTEDQSRRNARFGALFGFGAIAIVTLTIFVIPPFYDWFCRVTGFGGAPVLAEENTSEVLEQTIKVRFDASLAAGMPWEFEAVERIIEINIGQDGLAFYEAYNPLDRPIAGQASYNVSPEPAGGFFVKVDCFCFQEQVLMPGERVQMPVSFYVDPAIVDDPEGSRVPVITLSYTFFEIDLPEEVTAALETAEPATQETN